MKMSGKFCNVVTRHTVHLSMTRHWTCPTGSSANLSLSLSLLFGFSPGKLFFVQSCCQAALFSVVVPSCQCFHLICSICLGQTRQRRGGAKGWLITCPKWVDHLFEGDSGPKCHMVTLCIPNTRHIYVRCVLGHDFGKKGTNWSATSVCVSL